MISDLKPVRPAKATPLAQRIGQGAAVVLVLVLGIGGALLVALLIAWGCVAVVRQL